MLSVFVSAPLLGTTSVQYPERQCADIGGICKAHLDGKGTGCNTGEQYVADRTCQNNNDCCIQSTSEPDANGDVICDGTITQTRYNPEKLNAIMNAISDQALVTGSTPLVRCLGTGEIRIDYGSTAGGNDFVPFAKAEGIITATPSTNKIDIANGMLESLEVPSDRYILSPDAVYGDLITLQFIRDARQKINPMFKLTGNAAYEIESIFFGCEKKDENGRAVSCSMSGQLYKGGNAEKGYLTITGSGFVSEALLEAGYMPTNIEERYLSGHYDNVWDIRDESEGTYQIVAIPLADLKEIRITQPSNGRPETLNMQAKAQAETSSVDGMKIKSNKAIMLNDFIEGYRPQAFYGDMGRVEITAVDDIKATASPARMQDGMPFLIMLNESNTKVSVLMAGSRLVESDSEIYVFPESAEDAYNAFNSDYATAFDSILLKPTAKEMKIISVNSNINAYLPAGYDTLTLKAEMEYYGSMQGSIKVTNSANNMWILYSNNSLTWTPGKSIQQLGFNFNVEIYNPDTEDYEMLSCTKEGACRLGDTMVISPTGIFTQDKLTEGVETIRSTAPRRAEEGAKGIGEGSEETLGQKCDTDEDCGATEYCNLVGRERVCVLQEQREQGAKGVFSRAWDWVKGLFD